ncbi:hypothetical protein HOR51_gp04 [Ralstonia phage phiAp1]|uniref:Uncharacterized protein n=1 Tax=Ralstonia phage phiAp1 TaxID=2783867 RepID=A0A1L7DS93_9CAUD|nr:hypothetical protein HOR51_gp04 [Ralstonia phage phiAp1]APU03145.1 hypothetical protein phiAp1_04 [Ralstonia phage phiAp1]
MKRAEYMAVTGTEAEKRAAHRAYYAQFVGSFMPESVARAVGYDVLRNSTDKSFNDIPLKVWDSWHYIIKVQCATKAKQINEWPEAVWSLADTVCVVKEAARQWFERDLYEWYCKEQAKRGETPISLADFIAGK